MRFSNERKKAIIFYLLEKIQKEEEALSKSVSEAFSVNQNTVHNYINELVEEQIIKRVQRGKYELVTELHSYELKRKKGDLDSDTIALERCLSQHIRGFSQNVQSVWNYAFSEMINNVMDHSAAEMAQITVEQDYMNTTVMIMDNGVGIFHKIKEYFGLADLDEAICELFKGKLTTDLANHSGEGIFFTSKMMDEFFIVSGGKIFANNKYDNSRVINLAEEEAEGTCVYMSLSNFTHKSPQEVFDLYANVDGGFTKTKIPMKNIFDTAPVSRSQAKRVCNRLEKFKEVEIDFEDILWMGQGFAHQLFVVFAREYPDIVLRPVNMNEDVTKMYNHVMKG